MSDYRRPRIPGGCYFFTLALYDRQSAVLTDPPVRAALRAAIVKTRLTRPWSIDAWVLLPDHLHCIWTLPAGDVDYSARWSVIKRLTSQAVHPPQARTASASRLKRRESNLWQRRFWEHCIRDEDDFARHLDYVHWNPVKHGLVSRAVDWPWSSLNRWIGLGVYPSDWGLAEGQEAGSDHGEPAWR
ncbi:MAG: transposase [Chromatiaceae bacterium]